MSDIDFDELDQAISKVVGKATKDNISKPAPQPSSQISGDGNGDTHNATIEQSNESDSREVAVQNDSLGTSQKIVPHKEGRFMDMIHSGGYKPAQSTNEKSNSTTLSESKKTLAPSQPSAWIDPITPPETDVSLSSSDHDDTAASLSSTDDESTIEEQIGANDNIDSTPSDEIGVDEVPPLPIASHESPFIEGSEKKVSKRPLGGAALDDEIAKDNNIDDTTPKPTEQSDQTTDDEERSQDIVLPPELEKELVELEETNELRQAPLPNESLNEHTREEIASHNKKTSETQLADAQSPDNISTSLSGLLESGEASETYQIKQDSITSSHETLHPLFADSHTETASTSPKTSHHSMTPLRWIVTVIGLIMLGMIIGASVFLIMTGGSGL
jgi:hypothetical protein